jgi:hypothetical protein
MAPQQRRDVALLSCVAIAYAEGGEVFGALARTTERPGRGAGAPARRTTTGGGVNRSANLMT